MLGLSTAPSLRPHLKSAMQARSRFQDLFLFFRLCLFFREDGPGPAVPGPEPQDVLAADVGDRAFENSGTAGSFTDLARDVRSQTALGRPVHETKRLLELLVRGESEERGLLELHGQPASASGSGRAKTGSLVLFSKSARTILSLTVSCCGRCSPK